MSINAVLTNWKTVASNSTQFQTLVGAANAAAALSYIVSFAAEDSEKPSNDDVVMYCDIQDGARRRFGSTGAGIYSGNIVCAIDIKQSKVAALQPLRDTLEEFRGYVDTLATTIVGQIETYAIENGTLVLGDIDWEIFRDQETNPDAAVWVIELRARFGPQA